MSSVISGGYEAWAGTSMATPFVAGTLAMLLEQYPTDTASAIVARLIAGSTVGGWRASRVAKEGLCVWAHCVKRGVSTGGAPNSDTAGPVTWCQSCVHTSEHQWASHEDTAGRQYPRPNCTTTAQPAYRCVVVLPLGCRSAAAGLPM